MQVNVAFNTIGFHTALIVNKLRSQAQLTEQQPAGDECSNNEAGACEGSEREPERRHVLIRAVGNKKWIGG